jgi:hypothetical protein
VNSAIKITANISEELNKSNENSDTKRVGIQHTTASIGRQLIIEEDPFLWLPTDDLKGETESKIISAQDQALETKYLATKILQTDTVSKCGLCEQFDVTTKHIISVCRMLAKERYIKETC